MIIDKAQESVESEEVVPCAFVIFSIFRERSSCCTAEKAFCAKVVGKHVCDRSYEAVSRALG